MDFRYIKPTHSLKLIKDKIFLLSSSYLQLSLVQIPLIVLYIDLSLETTSVLRVLFYSLLFLFIFSSTYTQQCVRLSFCNEIIYLRMAFWIFFLLNPLYPEACILSFICPNICSVVTFVFHISFHLFAGLNLYRNRTDSCLITV